jgi:hypothetical protein
VTNRTFRGRLSTVSASIEGGVLGLMREMAPVVLFFFIAFLLIFVMFKLFVSQYEIEFSAFTKAAIAALILGKVVPLLDWAQSGYRFDNHRRAAVIDRQDFPLWSGRDRARDRRESVPQRSRGGQSSRRHQSCSC